MKPITPLAFLTLATTVIVASLLAQEAPKSSPTAPPPKAAKAKVYREPTWLMPPVEGPNLHYKTFDSKTVGERVSYLLYLPPDYETTADKRYPVVYWLHGIGGSQEGVPAMAQRLTNAITENKTPPMIVVYVNGMIRSGYVDSADGKIPVETVTIKELIPHMDATYRTIASREGRMVEGFSMGGGGAAKWGFKHPDVFGSISIIDGAMFAPDATGKGAEKTKAIDEADRARLAANDPWKLAEKNMDKLKGRTKIRIVTGSTGLSGGNKRFHEHLEQLGIANEFTTLPDVPHSPNPFYEALSDRNWTFYREAFQAALATK
jgi:enterochelin esterase-like enzyme